MNSDRLNAATTFPEEPVPVTDHPPSELPPNAQSGLHLKQLHSISLGPLTDHPNTPSLQVHPFLPKDTGDEALLALCVGLPHFLLHCAMARNVASYSS